MKSCSLSMMNLKLSVDVIWNSWILTHIVCPWSIFSSLYTTQAHSVHVPRWMQPCRGSIDSDPEVLVPSMLPNTQQSDQLIAHMLWTKADEVKLIATILRNEMALERIQSTDLQLYLDENTTFPGFPDHRMLNARTEFTERLQADYRRVSISSIFVEQLRRDEEQSTFSPSYAVQFRHIESQIYSLLCQLKMAILDKYVQLPYVSSDVMSNSFRNVDTHAQRHMRDYRVIKDLVLLFHAVKLDFDYSRIGHHLQTPNVDTDKR